MHARTARIATRQDDGFTLIELLVVILIIGILAALAIPSFLNQKGKGHDADAKAVVRTAQTAEETYFTDNQTYIGADATALGVIEATLTAPTAPCGSPPTDVCGLGVTAATASSYRVVATSKSRVAFSITRTLGGTTTHDCDVPIGTNAGGCALPSGQSSGAGTW